MQLHFKPTTEYQHFANQIYNLLVENSAQTFFVGGIVRNLIIEKEFNDIDIATALTPEQVINILHQASLKLDTSSEQFGVINALSEVGNVEIATLRIDRYEDSRYPKIEYISSAETDSLRRDFTINALYLQAQNDLVSDFHNGILDLNSRLVRFIGEPMKRVIEDPLRIIRAYKLASELDFEIEEQSKKACEENFQLLQVISSKRLQKELAKCDASTQTFFSSIIKKNS